VVGAPKSWVTGLIPGSSPGTVMTRLGQTAFHRPFPAR
jgi:hypothetical protein